MTKGFLNSQTIRNALFMLGTHAATVWESKTGQITEWALMLAPSWLDPSVPHIVSAVGALLAALFTAKTIDGRVKAQSRIKGMWKS